MGIQKKASTGAKTGSMCTHESELRENVRTIDNISVEEVYLSPEDFMKEKYELSRLRTIRDNNTIKILTLFSIGIIFLAMASSYALIAMDGLGIMDLPDKLVMFLGASTVSSIVTTGLVVVKYQVKMIYQERSNP